MTRPPLLLYDDDCGLCKWLVQWFLLWDRDKRLRTLPLQAPEADEILGHMTREDRYASFHLRLPDGRVVSGGDAFPELLRILPAGAPLAAAFARLPGPTDRAYRWVAANRTALSRPIRRSWKQRASERVASRRL